MESENHHDMGYPDGKLSMSDLLQNMANGDFFRDSMMNGGMEPFTLEDWERKLEQMRRKHDLNAGLERPFGMPPLFYNSHHMMECEKAFSLSNPYAYELKLPFLHELVRKFAEQRMEMDRHLPLMNDLTAPKGLSHSSLENLQSQQNVELKIPSYKPMRNYTNGVNPCGAGDSPAVSSVSSSNLSRINDTLKDIIAKSIAEKMRSRAQLSNGSGFNPSPLHSPSLPYSNGTQLADGNSSEDSQSSESFPKKRKIDTRRDKSDNVSSSVSSDSEKKQATGDGKIPKKTRPKRGQYRKYNSQLLLEAVRAVQRGEMSVHRAGSYFGVPHSTLEYKVKERHLLRQKKARENAKKPTSEASDGSPATSAKTSASDEGVEKQTLPKEKSEAKVSKQPAPKDNPKPSSSTSAPHSSVHDGLPPSYSVGASPLPMGFGWPPVMGASGLPMGLPDPAMAAYFPGFCGINMSASDLLKKLQRKVQANSGYKDGSDGDEEQADEGNLQGTNSKSHVTVK